MTEAEMKEKKHIEKLYKLLEPLIYELDQEDNSYLRDHRMDVS